MEFASCLLIFFADLVELLHVLEEVRAPLQGDEKLGFLTVTSVVGGWNCDRLGSDLFEASIVVSREMLIRACQKGAPRDG